MECFKKSKNVFKNNIFLNFKRNLSTFVFFIKGLYSLLPTKGLATQLGYQYKNFKEFLKKIKKNEKNNYYKSLPVIGGPNIIVEIDESKFG